MKKIYLICGGGMSTSILASFMQSEADQRNLPVYVEAFPIHQMDEILTHSQPDCILVAPQAKYLYQEIENTFNEKRIPVMMIDAVDYGKLNGNKVLAKAIILMRQNKYKNSQ